MPIHGYRAELWVVRVFVSLLSVCALLLTGCSGDRDGDSGADGDDRDATEVSTSRTAPGEGESDGASEPDDGATEAAADVAEAVSDELDVHGEEECVADGLLEDEGVLDADDPVRDPEVLSVAFDLLVDCLGGADEFADAWFGPTGPDLTSDERACVLELLREAPAEEVFVNIIEKDPPPEAGGWFVGILPCMRDNPDALAMFGVPEMAGSLLEHHPDPSAEDFQCMELALADNPAVITEMMLLGQGVQDSITTAGAEAFVSVMRDCDGAVVVGSMYSGGVATEPAQLECFGEGLLAEPVAVWIDLLNGDRSDDELLAVVTQARASCGMAG